jgi:hypothetical protein
MVERTHAGERRGVLKPARRGEAVRRPSPAAGVTAWAKGGGRHAMRRRTMAGRACELRRVRGSRVAPTYGFGARHLP